MRWQLAAFIVAGALATSSGTLMAHHSFAMFDQEHPIELVGTVKEFKYTSPHSYLLLEVKGPDGSTTVWNLEGRAPSLMARDGWTSGTLKPGDEIIITINPLRSGAPGGSWNTSTPKFKDGQPLQITPSVIYNSTSARKEDSYAKLGRHSRAGGPVRGSCQCTGVR